MFRLPQNAVLTPEMIVKYVQANAEEDAREQKLLSYYKGNTAIKQRVFSDETKPNNKVSNPYPNHLTNTAVGYFLGKKVQYSSVDENLIEQINQITRYNDDAAENTTLGKYASICGIAFELLYIDTDGQIRYKALDPSKCIPIFCNDLDGELLYFIRYWTDTDILTNIDTTFVQVYSQNEILTYRQDESALTLLESQPHRWGMVPVAIYANNDEHLGDWEQVIPLIDAYDTATSDALDSFDSFNDCYMVLKGLQGTEEDDLRKMKQNRMILVDNDAGVEYLIKDIPDAATENLKTRLNRDIHKLSGIPDITDENFVSTASGVALRYKTLNLELLTAVKETLFRRGLQKRFELICSILRLMGQTFDYRDIEITFTRNLPANTDEIVNVINNAGHLLSKETQLALLPYDLDVEKEIERKKAEDEAAYDNYAELSHNDGEQ